MSPKKQKYLFLVLVVALLSLLNFGIIVTNNLANGYPSFAKKHLVNEISGGFTLLLMLPFIWWMFKKYPIQKSNWYINLPIHLLASIVFGIGHTFLMYIVRLPLYQVFDLGEYAEVYGILKYRIAMEYFKQLITYSVAYVLFFAVQKWQETQKQKLELVQLEKQLTTAKLEALKMQLNPHFLFNTLNMVSSAMYEKPKLADQMLSELSDMLRRTLNTQQNQLHSLEKEMELLKPYMEIMKMRFGQKLDFKIDFQRGVDKALIPVFILQPILENAIKYSVENLGRARIGLKAHKLNGHLNIQISDEGPGILGKRGNGLGLSNTIERLEQLFGENHQLALKNKTDVGTEVFIQIPFIVEGENQVIKK